MGIYKLQGKAHLKNIGRFFTIAGKNIFRFMPGELDDLSEGLLESVKQYVPVRTGTLRSSLVASAYMNAIEVVARTDILISSEYAKEYAGYVEAGVFGKDETRLIKTPQEGGPILVKSPKAYEGSLDSAEMYIDQAVGEAAYKVINGYAQFMRAGIYDYFPTLMKSLARFIQYKAKKTYKGLVSA